MDDKFYWEIEDGKYLKSGEYYSVWSSGNSANLGDYSRELTIDASHAYYTFSFADGGDTRYLSLNKTSGNDYFAYYKGTQVNELYLISENGQLMDIDNVQRDNVQSTKVIKDGQLFIIRDGKTFNAQGAEVK